MDVMGRVGRISSPWPQRSLVDKALKTVSTVSLVFVCGFAILFTVVKSVELGSGIIVDLLKSISHQWHNFSNDRNGSTIVVESQSVLAAALAQQDEQIRSLQDEVRKLSRRVVQQQAAAKTSGSGNGTQFMFGNSQISADVATSLVREGMITLEGGLLLPVRPTGERVIGNDTDTADGRTNTLIAADMLKPRVIDTGAGGFYLLAPYTNGHDVIIKFQKLPSSLEAKNQARD